MEEKDKKSTIKAVVYDNWDFVSGIPEQTSVDSDITKGINGTKPVPALFGIDKEHMEKFQDAYIHSPADELRQFDILQEECAELIQAVSKIKRQYLQSLEDNSDTDKTEPITMFSIRSVALNLSWYKARSHLIEELTHVAISSAMTTRLLGISQDEIDAEVKRKDSLITTVQDVVDSMTDEQKKVLYALVDKPKEDKS